MRPTYADKLKARAQKRRKAFALIVLLIFLSLVASSLFGETGILVNLRVRAEYKKLRQERDHLLAENRRLREEIKALKHNPRKIEALGRREFGFGRPGEIIFYFPEHPDQAIQSYQFQETPDRGASLKP